MKVFWTSLLSVLLVSLPVRAAVHEVPLVDMKADSPLGRRVLGMARRVANNNNNYYNQEEDYNKYYNYEMTYDWVAGYSIKFEGCHQMSQWNSEADGEDAVRITTKRVVRFRLCPSNYCNGGDSKGCSSSYGDYIVDLDSFLTAYFEAKEQLQQNAQNQNYNNYNAANYYANQNNDDDAANYLTCTQVDLQRRKLENYNNYNSYNNNNYQNGNNQNGNNNYNNNNNNNNNYQNANNNANNYQYGNNQYNQWNGQQQNNYYQGYYYIGPYCASQGGAIYLGLFIDETCSTFADNNAGRDTYFSLAASYLPYASTSMVNMDCISCSENAYNNNGQDDNGQNYNYYENDQQDDDEVNEICETLYERSGKCENKLPSGTTFKQNNNACNYIEGIKIVRKDGSVMTEAKAKANRSASTGMGLLAALFMALSGYVYYLKTKLERSMVNLDHD